MEREGRFVRHDTGALGPQPNRDEVLVLSGGKVHEPIDSSAHSNDPPTVNVVNEKLGRVPRCSRLFGGEEAFLAEGHLEEAVPVGAGDGGS